MPETDYPNRAADPDWHETTDLDRYGRCILTVGALRTLLADLDDATHVVLDDGDGWYVNVAAVAAPFSGEDSDWQCLTLVPGETFDTRQV